MLMQGRQLAFEFYEEAPHLASIRILLTLWTE
jgi:hypothetical protein